MNTTAADIEREFVELATTPTITLYRLAQILSTLTSTHVREQMMYNYKKNNLLKCDFVDNRVVVSTVTAFVVKFVSKRIA